MPNVKPIPDDYPALTPSLVCRNAAAVIDFAKAVFGAVERMRLPDGRGGVAHAELEIGGSRLMVADPFPGVASKPPETDGSSPVTIHVYVEDVDETARRAEAAGAKVLIPVADQFYGDRAGRLMDPSGHVWVIASHVEDVSQEELMKRMAAMQQS